VQEGWRRGGGKATSDFAADRHAKELALEERRLRKLVDERSADGCRDLGCDRRVEAIGALTYE
jgi:hypothetical protein